MFYCKNCNSIIDSDDLEKKEICFETEYGVESLFDSRNYHTVYCCPLCNSDEIEEATQCEMCGEWLPEDLLTDTTEYINGGVGYCCEGCMQDADMRAI